MQPSVFISYRRRDSVAHVHALHGRLAAVLGAERVFMDVDAIELGTDFLAAIHTAIARCDMLIAVIGPEWAGGGDPGQRRIDRPDDVVRLEIAEALRAGIRVVPLLLGGVELPRAESLPADLAGLDRRQGYAIRDERFADDLDLFVLRVREQLGLGPAPGVRHIGSVATPAAPPGLSQLAEAVHRHWIRGVLESGVGGMIELGYRPRPDLVPNPFAELINPLPPVATDAVEADCTDDLSGLFEQGGRRLLLLGEAGAGKTTSLLLLARKLLDRYAADPAEPVPLVLHLGSWRPAAGALDDWLAAEMNLRYRLPVAIARGLLRDGRLLPMLDGLDELPRQYREACVAALGAWGQQTPAPGWVVCCRRADYEALGPRLAPGTAVEIAPLDGERLRALWRSRGVTGPALERLSADPGAVALGRTPLMAGIVSKARRSAVPASGSEGMTAQALLDAYIVELFRRAPPARRAPQPGAMLHRLGWVAERLRRAGQSELSLERLDAGWLASPWQRGLFRLGFGALVGVLAGLVLAVYWGTLTPNLDLRELGCPGGAVPGTCAAMRGLLPLWPLVGVLWGVALVAVDPWLPRRTGLGDARRQIPPTLLVAALYLGVWWLLWWGIAALGTRLVLGPIALSGFALSVLIAAWRSQRPGLTGAAMTVEAMAWRWPAAARGLLYGLPVGLGLWIINSLLLGEWIPGLLVTHLLAALTVGFLLGGLRGRALPSRIRPNEGIRLSARNALIALVVFGLAGALIGTAIGLLLGDLFAERLPALPGGPAELNPDFVARYALATAASLGIIAGLWLGGAEVIKHLVLRLIAAAGTPLPLDVAGFLDRACDLGLMQRVGGGYRFAHRLLGEHIAGRVQTELGPAHTR